MERDREVHDPVHVVVENESKNLSSGAEGPAVHLPEPARRLAPPAQQRSDDYHAFLCS